MNLVTTVLAVVAMLGSALIGGIFYAFSSFIMKALARMPTEEGIAAMQSINIVVINASFLGAFIGTAVISLMLAVLAIKGSGMPSAPWLLAGALLYLLGTFLVTALGNVPLNEELAAVSATDSSAVAVWEHFLDQWTTLNTLRATASVTAALSLTIGLTL